MTDALFDRLMSDERVIEIRGDELRTFIEQIPDRQKWIDGSQLRDYLLRQNPSVIRAVRNVPVYSDGAAFGWAMGRDWYVGEDADIPAEQRRDEGFA